MKINDNYLDILIKGIHIVPSNLDYIKNNHIINGTLYMEIKRVAEEYAKECVMYSFQNTTEYFNMEAIQGEDGMTNDVIYAKLISKL